MRRLLSLLPVALLGLPFLATLHDPLSLPLTENRPLAPAPAPPRTWAETKAFPGAVNAWIGDHFGLRNWLLVQHNRARYALFGEYPSDNLLPGKDGEIFYNFRTGGNGRIVRNFCGLDLPPQTIAVRSAEVAAALTQMRALRPQTYVFAIPDKASVKPEKLPDWLQAECRRATPPVPAIVAAATGTPGLATGIAYPIDVMRRSTPPPFPPANFHWSVEGAWPIARVLAEDMLHLARAASPELHPVAAISDLFSFMPGLLRPIAEAYPDMAAAGIAWCRDRPDCFPEFPDLAGLLVQVSRFRQTGPGPRAVILSDSFGAGIAPGFSPYFSELWHFQLNFLDARFSAEQKQRLHRAIFETFNPDMVLIVLSEGAFLWRQDMLDAVHRLMIGETNIPR